MDATAAALGVGLEGVAGRVADLGRGLGPPWREDQKLAAAAAWLALVSASGAGRGKRPPARA